MLEQKYIKQFNRGNYPSVLVLETIVQPFTSNYFRDILKYFFEFKPVACQARAYICTHTVVSFGCHREYIG